MSLKDKNGYTAAEHAGMGKTARSVADGTLCKIWPLPCLRQLSYIVYRLSFSSLSCSHKSLSTHLSRWSSQPSLHLYFLPRFWWTFNLLLPGLFLLLGMLLFSHVHQPVGFVSAVFAVGGFMWSLSGHRLSHDCRWPNPALFGSLLSGMVYTGVCYFLAVLPNILLCPALCLIFDTCILLAFSIGSTPKNLFFMCGRFLLLLV